MVDYYHVEDCISSDADYICVEIYKRSGCMIRYIGALTIKSSGLIDDTLFWIDRHFLNFLFDLLKDAELLKLDPISGTGIYNGVFEYYLIPCIVSFIYY